MWLLILVLVLPLYAQDSEIRLVPVTTGLAAPTDVQNAGDGSGRLFIVQQAGLIRIFRDGAFLPAPFLDIRTRTRAGGERGLLGLAFPPGFAGKQRFYVNYTDLNGDTVIAMYRVTSNPDIADPASETVLLNITQPYENHNGGQLRFGPDGYLYIGMGDGGSSGDPQNNAQNRGSLLGKLLRIDVESEPGRVRIPPDNPFVNTSGARPEVWAYGLRNPWRFSFDRATGDLFIADVGQNAWEEVNFTPASSRGGENYGWPQVEGLVCYRSGCSMDGVTMPVTVYGHQNGDCSVTGGFMYRGNLSPGLRGTYLYADYCTGRTRILRREGDRWVSSVALTPGGEITTFGESEDGEIYAADGQKSTLFRIEGSRAPRIAVSGVVNAASFAPGLVAGSLATVFAAGVLDDPGAVSAATLPLPASLSGVSITVNGVAAPILAVSNKNGIEQVNFQVPFEAAGRATVPVVITRSGFSSAPVDVPVVNSQPGLYPVVVHNADFTLAGEQRPLARNEFAFVYAAGLGRVSNPPATGAAASAAPRSASIEDVRITLGGIPCEVQFAGLAPDFAGVYQLNFRVPANAPSGLQDLVVTAGGVSSPAIKVPVS
jgi:uncharacterized protein (TIGR03437 family)